MELSQFLDNSIYLVLLTWLLVILVPFHQFFDLTIYFFDSVDEGDLGFDLSLLLLHFRKVALLHVLEEFLDLAFLQEVFYNFLGLVVSRRV